jgi:hypothetical protein
LRMRRSAVRGAAHRRTHAPTLKLGTTNQPHTDQQPAHPAQTDPNTAHQASPQPAPSTSTRSHTAAQPTVIHVALAVQTAHDPGTSRPGVDDAQGMYYGMPNGIAE